MKTSKREKILLSIFLIVMLLAGYYKFIFSVRMDKITELKDKRDKYSVEIDKLKNNVIYEKQLNKEIKIVNSQIYGNIIELFPSIKQEKIIVILNDMIEKSGVQCDSFSISKPEFQKLNEEQKTESKQPSMLEGIVKEYKKIDGESNNKVENNSKANADKDNKENKTSSEKDNKGDVNKDNDKKNKIEAENMTIGINVKGTFDNVMKFIDEITNYDKRIIIKNISVTADESNLAGNLTLEFFGVPKFSLQGDSEYLKWDFKNQYGKINPFFDNSTVKSQGTVANSTAKSEVTVETKRSYDFSMNVVAISSDLPTVILGKIKDSTKKSYVISDNPGIENVEIYVTESNGKYYYKYKNGKEAYPKDLSGSGVQFTPMEDTINISVFSCSRNSNQDLAGANVKIYNNTDKELIVDIKYDDKNKPRVNVIKESGKVTVNRN
ncbi:hypothetical protein [Clostridium sp. ZS2-4]|uniref:hypothetical protein n=1 Tax=Clostridium sp. ZS2-4 TaxID=2987703 RepID=UPI00227A963B|nr:hypothetical protein [Clostridium sp. ZS2-4]MCY6355049.1 hypothetical protein [Clostridium sp. ZS2-4]